jgi:hypothetical protein
MKWIEAKSEEQINEGLPPNVRVEFETVGTTHHSLNIFVDEVPVLAVKKGNYSMDVCVPKPPEYEDKWALTGTFSKLSVNEIFDHEHEARERERELKKLGVEDCHLEITKVQVAKE